MYICINVDEVFIMNLWFQYPVHLHIRYSKTLDELILLTTVNYYNQVIIYFDIWVIKN